MGRFGQVEPGSAENNNPSPVKLCRGLAGFNGSDKSCFQREVLRYHGSGSKVRSGGRVVPERGKR